VCFSGLVVLLDGVEISVGGGGRGDFDREWEKRNGNEWCSLLGETDVPVLLVVCCGLREDRVLVGERDGGLELMLYPYVDSLPAVLEGRSFRPDDVGGEPIVVGVQGVFFAGVQRTLCAVVGSMLYGTITVLALMKSRLLSRKLQLGGGSEGS
jgi:hypothetical protein